MHHCLNIDEILLRIIGHIGQPSALYKVGLVCRAFHGPANDELWCNLPGLSPLVKCLPDCLIAPSNDYDDTLTIIKAPLPAEWESLRRHARLVKSLQVSLEDEDHFAVDLKALEILTNHHTGPLLPNLEELYWNNWSLAEYAPLFVHPSLVVLEFTPTGEEELGAVLNRVASSAPQLETLVLNDCTYDTLDILEPEFTRAITSLKHLTTLDFEHLELPLDAFLHMSRLPDFNFLSLLFTQKHRDLWLSSSWGGLPGLRRFSLESSYMADSCTRTAEFLESLSGQHLTLIKLRLHPPSHAADLTRLMTALSRFEKLIGISIAFDMHFPIDWGDIVLDGDAIAPLRKIPHIFDFSLVDVPISFSPDAVRDLSATWKYLRNFALTSRSPTLCHMRLEDLAHFSQNCHLLETLDVQIHPVDADWTCDADVSWSLCALSSLDLQRSRIALPAAPHVAAYLAKFFQVAKLDHSFPTRKMARWLGQEPPAEELMAGKIIRAIAKQKDKLVPDVLKQGLATREDIFDGVVVERWR